MSDQEPTRAIKQAERAELVSQLVNGATGYALIGMNAQGRINFWSAGAQRLLGWSEAEVLGEPASLIFTPEDRDAGVPAQEIGTAREKGQAEDVRWHLRKDGSRFWADGQLSTLNDGSGGFVKVLRDFSAQRETELALRRSKDQQRRIVESASDYAIFTMDCDNRITTWNPGAERLLGYTEAEALGRSAKMIFTSEQRHAGEFEREKNKALMHNRAHSEREHLRKDGSRFWSSQTLMPLRDDWGALDGYLQILRDRSEEKRAVDRLSASEARFRLLAEMIPQLVWRSHDDGHWIGSGPQWQEYTGQTAEQSADRGWVCTVHPDDREPTMQAWHHAMKTGLFEVEHRIQRASDGAYQWFSTRAVPLRDGKGRTIEWFGTSTDVHQLKRLQEHQQVLLAELQHRTRNLLAIVRSVARQTAGASGSLEEFGPRFYARLSALGRVQGLIARVDSRGVDLDELVRAELSAHGAEPGERVRLDGPKIQLRPEAVQTLSLALHELATNALKYGALSQSDGRLDVGWRIEDSHLALNWRESGVAMPEDGPPARRGYGRTLIELALPYDVGAQTNLEFGNDGVRCRIDVPLDKVAL